MSAAPRPLPDGRIVAFYGDDFTGSAAVMEVLSFAGLNTVLFLAPPTPAQLASFAGYRGIGIAGTARSQGPEWMERELPPIFRALAALGAPIVQYKICSTLDSSPVLGSIGRAAEIGMAELGGNWHPILAAAPAMGRYQAFGTFFAVADGVVHRLDRHPVMSRHPATPIDEADIRLHIGRQTVLPIGLVDLVALKTGMAATRLWEEREQARLIAIDAVDDETIREAGRLIWGEGSERVFAIASQGLQYALIAYWRHAGLIGAATAPRRAGPVDRMVVVSGSCSGVTAGQIAWGTQQGFEPVAVDARRALTSTAWEAETGRAVAEGLRVLSSGRDVILHTALGPDDPAVGGLRAAIESAGADAAEVSARIGRGLGVIADRLLRRTGLRRAVVAGGDTSSFAVSTLDIHALTALSPVCAGGSLLKVHSDDLAMKDVEIALKGGQMGPPDYFGLVRQGGPP